MKHVIIMIISIKIKVEMNSYNFFIFELNYFLKT